MNNTEHVMESDDQLLRIRDVSKLTTLSKSSINLWIAQGRFPKPITLSQTVKVWHLKDVRIWAESMKNQ
jgi:predicted DNA-binding transcriptional regulator AlpA